MDITKLEEIIRILKLNDVTEFELNNNGTHIKLSRTTLQASSRVMVAPELYPAVTQVVTNGTHGAESEAPATTINVVPSNWIKVESPIVGTFYRKPGPDKDFFVSEGQSVKKGDTLCIIEAMKLMNEIEAPESGKIEKVLVPDSKVVEYGEVLFYINPSA